MQTSKNETCSCGHSCRSFCSPRRPTSAICTRIFCKSNGRTALRRVEAAFAIVKHEPTCAEKADKRVQFADPVLERRAGEIPLEVGGQGKHRPCRVAGAVLKRLSRKQRIHTRVASLDGVCFVEDDASPFESVHGRAAPDQLTLALEAISLPAVVRLRKVNNGMTQQPFATPRRRSM